MRAALAFNGLNSFSVNGFLSTPWKYKKAAFLMFTGVKEREHWYGMN